MPVGLPARGPPPTLSWVHAACRELRVLRSVLREMLTMAPNVAQCGQAGAQPPGAQQTQQQQEPFSLRDLQFIVKFSQVPPPPLRAPFFYSPPLPCPALTHPPTRRYWLLLRVL